ncbi:MAG: type IV toxin-antitoxin system AbiEi family antitoxin, partial [Nitrospirota bacterium]|nr:type IV toxin-antitoxin system AbiEi family antitoxin [Nitrospirota bacterium]
MPRNLTQIHLQEAELLEHAIGAFRAATGLRIEVEQQNAQLDDHGHKVDAVVRLRTREIDEEFIVALKLRLTNAILGGVAQRLTGFPQQGMLVTNYVNPRMADRLKQMDLPFIDTVGNAYLNIPPVFIFIKGNRPLEKLAREPMTRAFQPAGLRVVFAFLCHPALVTAPYRDIARAADVALGTVAWVVTNLKELGYLVDMGKRGRRLANRKKLLDRWVTAYPEQLRPKLLIGRFGTTKTDWWKDAPLTDFKA